MTEEQQRWLLAKAGWKRLFYNLEPVDLWEHPTLLIEKTQQALAHPATTVALLEWIGRNEFDLRIHFGRDPYSSAPVRKVQVVNSIADTLAEAVQAAALELMDD